MREETEDDCTSYRHDDWDKPDFIRTHCLVTMVKVRSQHGHERVTVFTRGGNTGTIIVDRGYGKAIAQRLIDGKV